MLGEELLDGDAAFLRDWKRARAFGGQAGRGLRATLACLLNPGVQAMAVYRLGSWALAQPGWLGVPFHLVYFLLNFLVKALWGIEISRKARIGPGFYIGHFGGITVSSRAVIGTDCAIAQSVTIGVAGEGPRSGAPVIGNDVYIGPGARLFGPIRIGNNVKIGANAVVHKDIPDNAVVALDPGFKIISYRGNRRMAA